MKLKVVQRTYIVLLSLLSLVVCSCEEEDEIENPQKVEISVDGFDESASVMKGAIINFHVNVDDVYEVDKIELRIDDVLKETFTSVPFDFIWETKEYSEGSYKLSFIAYKENEEKGVKELSVEITAPLTVTDYDGNVYQTVQIGTQIWMVENLKTTHYRNGDEILYVGGIDSWIAQTNGALCNYDNNNAYSDTYGYLYNYFTIEDPRGLCPEGWRVPTKDDISDLIDYLGGYNVAGSKLKEAGSVHWSSPLTTAVNDATNESGYTALPGGCRNASGDFTSIGYSSMYWMDEGFDNLMNGKRSSKAWTIALYANKINSEINYYAYLGLSVRCIKE